MRTLAGRSYQQIGLMRILPVSLRAMPPANWADADFGRAQLPAILADADFGNFLTLRFQAVCGFWPLECGCILGPCDFKQYADFCTWYLDALLDPEISSSMQILALGI